MSSSKERVEYVMEQLTIATKAFDKTVLVNHTNTYPELVTYRNCKVPTENCKDFGSF